MRPRWVLAGTLLAVSGCYRYVASEPSALRPGAMVEVELTSVGRASVRPSIGDFATTVEGNVTEANGSGLTLSLTSVRRRGEVQPSTWNGESLHLAPSPACSSTSTWWCCGPAAPSGVPRPGGPVGESR